MGKYPDGSTIYIPLDQEVEIFQKPEQLRELHSL